VETYYYYQHNWLQGPVSSERLRDLVQSGSIDDETPVWSPAYSGWISVKNVIENESEGAFVVFEDAAALQTQKLAASLHRPDLPSARNMLALRLAREQEFITGDQCSRCLREITEKPNPDLDLLEWLSERGWITASQKATLAMVLQRNATPRLIGGYEIIEELGRGGMGTTYKARQIAMDRIVALKVLQPKLGEDAEYVARFEREARMAARLNHENIATAYEVGSVGGQHYMSMEYVEGEALSDRLAKGGPMREEDAIPIILQICRALQAAYESELVHRDVSPKNIIIKPNGQAKLIDMGLAKSVKADASSFTAVGITVGTPAYISPEQALGKSEIDIRSDIYSLGCVLYEMLTGEPALMGTTVVETLTRHINEPVPPLRSKLPQASERISYVVARMTALKPEDRFQTPNEVIAALTADAETVHTAAAKLVTALPPVREQLAAWEGAEAVEVRLRPDQREYVHLVARALENRLAAMKVDAEAQGYIQTIFAELVANAFDHGCKGVKEGTVRIHMELNEAFFRLEVEDPGAGFPAAEMLERIKREPLNRERRRGIMQILAIAASLSYSPKGNLVKAVYYLPAGESGISIQVANEITYIEIKGKGDLALSEKFVKWVDTMDLTQPQRICLLIRTEWVSSMFVGAVGKLHTRVKEAGSALSVWVEHRSCFRILQQLGLSSFVRLYDSLEMAELALRYESVGAPSPSPAAAALAEARESAKKEEGSLSEPEQPRRRKPGGDSGRQSSGRTPRREVLNHGEAKSATVGWWEKLRRWLGRR